jgi:hypothetical protein
MKGKILFVAGLGLGYVLGTRAGREKYDQLKTAALKVWNDPRLQKQVDAAQEFVKDKAPEVAEFVTDGAKTLVDKVSGKSPAAAKKPATRKPSGGAASSSSSTAKS